MPWPEDEELPIGAYAAFGADLSADPATWEFTDLSDRLMGIPIPVRRGAGDGAGEASPGKCTLVLRNDDGELSPLLATSSLYPNVDLNTPVLVDVRRIVPVTDSDSFTAPSTNNWGTSDQGRTWTSLSAGGTPSAADFQVASGSATLSVPATLAYRLVYLPVDVADVDAAITVSAPVTVTGGPIEPGNILLRFQDSAHYYLFRINAIAGGSILAEISATGASEMLTSATVPGLTWSSGVPLRIRAQAWGTWLRMRVWRASDPEPTTWALTVTCDDYLSGGGVGIRSGIAPGNSNAKPIVFSHDNFVVTELPTMRMDGFADSWEPTYIPQPDGTTVSAIRLTASGLLRRLGQGDPADRSPLYRMLSQSDPIAWWSLEDGEDSTQAAPGVDGGIPMTVASGTMNFETDGPPGSSGCAHPMIDAENAMSGPIIGGSATAWQMSVWARGVGTTGLTAGGFVPMEVRTSTGKILRFGLQFNSNTAVIGEYDSEAQNTTSNVFAVTYTTLGNRYAVDGEWHLIQATYAQVGADTAVQFYYDGDFASGGNWTGVTIGAPISVNAIGRFGGPGSDISPDMTEMAIAAPAVHNGAGAHAQYSAGIGWVGEAASDRIARVCDEDSITVLIDPGDSEPLGVQSPGGTLDILREASRADMGLLTEHMFGLRYRPRFARYNLLPVLTVDLATYRYPGTVSEDSIIVPTYDDQSIRNDWSVSRKNGSTARAIDAEHAARYGTYGDSVDLSVATDSILGDHAGWRVRLGTWQEMRYPTLPLHLEANPDLIDEWVALTVGDRVDRINVPSQHPAGTVSQIVGGYSETLAPKAWTVTASCAPYGPWEVATVGGAQRVSAVGSTIGANGITSSGLALVVTSTATNRPWRTTASNAAVFPMDARVGGIRRTGGEQVTVSAIGSVVTDSFTRTGSSWGTSTSGHVWAVGGGTASNFSTNGSSGLITPSPLNVEHIVTTDVGASDIQEIQLQCLVAVTPTGAPINWGAMLRFTDSSNYVWLDVQVNTDLSLTLRAVKRVAGTATFISSVVSSTLGSTSVPRILRARVDGIGLYSRVWSSAVADPGGWELSTSDASLPTGTRAGVIGRVATGNTNVGTVTLTYDNWSVPDPQLFTLSNRSVNGVVRAWPAGTSVDVWNPAIVAL